MKNWKKSNESDFDARIAEKTFLGRLTKKRYQLILNFVKRFNHNHSAPYGRSEAGYAYRCGCEHDCCGCLTSEYIDIELKRLHKTEFFTVSLKHVQSFNY